MGNKKVHGIKKIDVVITSCNRLDLLKKTIDSFVKHNTYPINQIILIDDSGSTKKELLENILNKISSPKKIIVNPRNIGQIQSIDIAYAAVKSDYIFHLEDDWEFFKSSFIEHSIEILDENPKVINVWLRAINDTNNHPIDEDIKKTKSGLEYQLVSTNHSENWHGFSFNPGLRRASDYKKIAPFSGLEEIIPKGKKSLLYVGEVDISVTYFKLGYRGAIITSKDGYVKHIGNEQHIPLPWKNSLRQKFKYHIKKLLFKK